jgi:EAL domain-containing protein (putative c-di-GMP-specific phosphodiesterase class I)
MEVSEHVRLSASAGISVFPTGAKSAEDLLYQASIALSQADATGNNRIEVFSPERREQSKVLLELEWKMRKAIEHQEFRLCYQPELDLRSGKLIRREALLRWDHPEGHIVSPASFVPIAEQTGLIVPLGNWVLQEACHAAQSWQDGVDRGVGVAVNVSALQLNQPDFAAEVARTLKTAKLPGELLELEITESALMGDFSRSVAEIVELRRLGVSVVIDDFGVGYSSLTYLRDLPVTGVKLDRSFLRDLQRNPNALPLLRSIVSLAHGLQMSVTVEGVERPDELEEIRKLGVDAAQGFLLGRPEWRPLEQRTANTGT